MSTTITLTPYLDENPAPRVEVLVQGAPAGTITITRTADGRTMPVRGAIRTPTAGGVTRIDSEVPFGVAVVYQVQEFDPDGTPGPFTTSSPVTLDVRDTWIHQPLEPRLAAKVDLTGDSAPHLVRGFEGETVYPDGASLGVWVGGRRHGLEGLNLLIEPPNVAAADMLQQMLGGYDVDQVPVLCIRTPPTYSRLPRTLFLTFPKPDEQDINVRYGGTLTVLEVTGDETRPPAPALVAALLRYQDTDEFFGSYAAIDSYYGSYLARDRDYAKAGFAG